MSQEHQITDLEIRIAYLEDSLNTLDTVVSRQAREIDRLEKTNRMLIKKLEILDEIIATGIAQPGDEPPPPHY